jgi:hypothetical protein
VMVEMVISMVLTVVVLVVMLEILVLVKIDVVSAMTALPGSAGVNPESAPPLALGPAPAWPGRHLEP